jgi:hypothetical protein
LKKKSIYGLWALGVVTLVLFFWWLLKDPTSKFAESVPGADNRGADSINAGGVVEIGRIFSRLEQQLLPRRPPGHSLEALIRIIL